MKKALLLLLIFFLKLSLYSQEADYFDFDHWVLDSSNKPVRDWLIIARFTIGSDSTMKTGLYSETDTVKNNGGEITVKIGAKSSEFSNIYRQEHCSFKYVRTDFFHLNGSFINSRIDGLPTTLNYQCIVRDSSANIQQNATIILYFTILEDSKEGKAFFSEIDTTTTNNFGLVSASLGSKCAVPFLKSKHSRYFLKVECYGINANSLFEGVTELISSPYGHCFGYW